MYTHIETKQSYTLSLHAALPIYDYIPTPAREMDKPFLMPVEDIFTIQGRGTVAKGRIERGMINVNEPVEIVGIKDTRNSVRSEENTSELKSPCNLVCRLLLEKKK